MSSTNMNMDSKLTYAMFAVVFVVALGAYFFPSAKNVTEKVVGAVSPTGSTYLGAGQAFDVTMATAIPGVNGTSSVITNNTGHDLYIRGVHGACQGVGTSQTAYTGTGLTPLGWTLSVGTTSLSAATITTAATTFTWTPVVSGFGVATGSVNTVFASSTPQLATSTLSTLWQSGVGLAFVLNATNTANCTFGVDASGS